MKIAVAGMGYVGLSLAILLSQHNDVMAYDIAPDKVAKINQKTSPIQDEYIERYLTQKDLRLSTTTNPETAFTNAEYVIVAVPTNYDPDKNSFDTTCVENAIQTILKYNTSAVIIIKSTVPIGYTDSACAKFGIKNILFSPEFLREGLALYDNLHPSRIIVGAYDEQREQAERFAHLLAEGAEDTDIPIRIIHPTEAEAVKLFANTYLAMRVSYFNELDTYAQMKGLNSREIIDGVCLDSRVGYFYNNPSFGYGGYCLPKDTKQLLANFRDVPQAMIEAVVRSNTERKEFIAKQIIAKSPKTVGIFRLTMKANSDNFRSSAVFDIIQYLEDEGISVIIYEPSIHNKDTFSRYTIVNDLEQFKEKSDIILANRYEKELESVLGKVYTRDLYCRD